MSKQPVTANNAFDERKRVVRNFINACLNNHAKITSFDTLKDFLNKDRIKLLCKIERSGESVNAYGQTISTWFTKEDAEEYFEWLVAVVNETEGATNETRMKANDQLFRFLYLMRDDIERSQRYQVIEPYDWQNLFSDFDRRLDQIRQTVDYHDKSIVEVLKSLLKMTEKNVILLESLKSEYKELFPQMEEK